MSKFAAVDCGPERKLFQTRSLEEMVCKLCYRKPEVRKTVRVRQK